MHKLREKRDQILGTATSLKPSFSNENGLEVFPNPVSQTLFLNKTTDVAIYDANGRRIRVERNVNEIDIFDLNAGVYLLLTAEGESTKIIK